MAKKIWTHPKKKNKTYRGTTVTAKIPGTGSKKKNIVPYWETTFTLVPIGGKKFEAISFESWQQAVKQGWVRK